MYSQIRQGGHPSNRTILPKIRLAGQFCFWVIRLTGQLENLDRLTVLVMLNKSVLQDNFNLFWGPGPFYFQNCPPGRLYLYIELDI